VASPGRGGEPTRTRSRYPAIDILRGLALISMASSHVLHYQLTTVIGVVLHRGQWIDGAFFFVALSGVVVGLVHRRIAERSGLRPSVVKLLRRAAFLYVVHIGLTLLSILAAWSDDDDIIVGVPAWSGWGDVPRLVRRVLLLRLEPEDNGVLPIYVVFLLLAIPAVALLRRGHWRVVIAASLAIFSAGWLVGGVSFVPGEFSLTAWQALFIGGLLVGWTWEHERLRLAPEVRRVIVSACFVVAGGFLALALAAPGHGWRLLGWTVHKMAGGPMAFLYAAVVLVVGYVVVERGLAYRWVATLLTPIRILGSKGLPGYAALQVAVVGLDLFPDLPRNDMVIIAVVIVCGLTEYAAVRWQEWRRRPAPGAGVDAPAPGLDVPAGGAAASDIAGDEPATAVASPFRDVVDVDDGRPGWSDRSAVIAPGQRS
jgi:hypothetical protein